MKGSSKLMMQTVAVALIGLLAIPGIGMAKQTTITYAYRVTHEASQKWIDWVVEEFENQNPDINVEIVAWDAGKLPVEVVSGVAPDITLYWSSFGYDWALEGLLLDLSPFIERDITEEDRRDFFPPAWEACQILTGDRAGEQYGMPTYGNAGITYYNITALEMAGLDPQLPEGDEWTWDMFRTYARKLTRFDSDPSKMQYGADIQGRNERITGLVGIFGGRMFSQDPLAFTMDEPEVIQALDFHQTMIHGDGVIPVPGGPAPQGWVGFYQGRIPILLEAATTVPYFQQYQEGDFKWTTVPWPTGPAGRISWYAQTRIGITRSSKNPEAAWRFVKFLSSPEAAMKDVEIRGFPPSRLSAVETYAEQYRGLNLLQSYSETAMTARLFEQSQVPSGGEVISLVYAALSKIWQNEASPKMAISEIAPQVDAIFSQYK